jgi:hypothetical protein
MKMATYDVDDEGLRLILTLDPDEPDFSQAQADQIWEIAIREILSAADREESPTGVRWTDLRPSTLLRRRDPGARIGWQTGRLFGEGQLQGTRSYHPRRITWQYADGPRAGSTWGRAHGFHNGNPRNRQPARPFVGWTRAARDQIDRLIRGDD